MANIDYLSRFVFWMLIIVGFLSIAVGIILAAGVAGAA